jgi:serralysin
MEMLRKMLVAPLMVGALVAGVAIPVAATGSGENQRTIVDVLVDKSSTKGFDHRPADYDLLIQAVTTADLVDPLADPDGDLTVFAPNDAAFLRTAQDLGYTGSSESGAWSFLVQALTDLGGGDPVPVLKNILLYHVADQRIGAVKVVFSPSIDTLLGASFGVRRGIVLVDKDPQVANPFLSLGAVNIRAKNGVIHTISRVLIPVDIP